MQGMLSMFSTPASNSAKNYKNCCLQCCQSYVHLSPRTSKTIFYTEYTDHSQSRTSRPPYLDFELDLNLPVDLREGSQDEISLFTPISKLKPARPGIPSSTWHSSNQHHQQTLYLGFHATSSTLVSPQTPSHNFLGRGRRRLPQQ